MTDAELERKIDLKVEAERRLTTEVVELIAQAEARKLYALRGYKSLYDWLTKKYKYSEGSANRRIAAARLLGVSPEVKTKMENGDLNLTTMAKAQSIIRASEKASKKSVSDEVKLQALEQIENQSTVQAEQTLLGLFPDAASHVKQDRVHVIDQNTSRLSANIPNEVMDRYTQVRDLLSNTLPNVSFVDAADYLFKRLIEENAAVVATAAKQSVNDDNQTVTPRTKRIVRQEGCCTYKDPVTGRVCGSRYQVQVDHCRPRAMGGGNEAENLRAYCAVHNRLAAEQVLGKDRANKWREQQAH